MMFVARDNTITEPSQEVVCSLYIGDYVLGQEQYYDHTFKEIDSLIYRAFSHFSTIRLKLMFVGHHSERTWGVHQQLEALLRRYRRLLNHKPIHAEFDCILPDRYAAFIQTPDLKDQSSLWKPIADLVTSGKPPVDLPRAFLKLSELWDKFQINSADYEDGNTILSEAEDAVNEFDVDRFVKKRAELIELQRRMLGQSVDELYGHDDLKLHRLRIIHDFETLRRELGESEDLST
ncbi:hypothetical protein LTR70_008912 [Exophiala xenobiotica]|uniref:Uncharacterized protein n=1 Tax=Lithohypha guttulata TaxID=1690604 RepID=A0ABR0JYM3_9EURO|nr:hypothetical protein LTR24_008905 [Lithohypha guttulata]KAK5311273.1 hypothetical protein LTR70_008912 [Exophiala xenobiotica]